MESYNERLFAPRGVLFFLLLCVLALSIPQSAFADDADYIRGYVDSVLNIQHPDSGIYIAEISTDNAISLTANNCITPALKLAIEKSLASIPLRHQVAWVGFEKCSRPADPLGGKIAAADAEPEIAAITTEELPKLQLFAPLIADPRETRSSLSLLRYNTSFDEFNAGAISAGDSFPLIKFYERNGKQLQLGIEGAIFSLFDLAADSSDLVNTDFILGLPLEYRSGKFSARARIYHQSSHLGDEFLLANPEVERVNFGYEDAEVILAYELGMFRLYGGGGTIFRSEPDLDPLHAQWGLEHRWPELLGNWDGVVAGDFKVLEELSWTVNQSYQAGFAYNKFDEREIRLMLQYYDGFSPNGQFFRDELDYFGIGVFIDL